MQKLKSRLKINRGSILAVSLIILGLMLVSALSFALVSIQERKASTGENKSSQAFQTASTGVEIVLQSIRDHIGGKLSDIDDGICDGKISSPNGYTVQLQDDAGNPVTGCNTSISAVKKVKSIGTAGGNQRAVEVAVAMVHDPGVGTCYNSADILYIQLVAKGSSCPSGFSQCTTSQYKTAAAKGCLPIIDQYGTSADTPGVPVVGCLSDGGSDWVVANGSHYWSHYNSGNSCNLFYGPLCCHQES